VIVLNLAEYSPPYHAAASVAVVAGAKLAVLLDDLSPLSARGAEAQSPFHPRPKMTTMRLAHVAPLVLLAWRLLFRPLSPHFFWVFGTCTTLTFSDQVQTS
jgi:hypothetical protein